MTELLTPDELAARLKLPPDTIKRWRVFGKGPRWIQAGKHVRYPVTEVDKWIADELAKKDPAA
jgi:excisionase family DNA binding protein